MADQRIVVDSGSPERIALELARQIASMENASLGHLGRVEALRLFAECLRVAKGGPAS